jgi:hypothetical protein
MARVRQRVAADTCHTLRVSLENVTPGTSVNSGKFFVLFCFVLFCFLFCSAWNGQC